MPVKSMFATQEGPANALALNKENNQVVIAGRNVFKVFTIEDDEFVESCNLRVGKNLNLNFSCNDVAWNQIEDHRLATAATNGAVVVWDLNRTTRSKQEHVFADHKRTVNKVSFHTTEPTWLISGSQDGTMKCFDTKTREATMTFFSNTESVRDVQFSPHTHRQFAAVSENGSVQLWDMRRPDRCYRQFTAHSGPVFACDWHPETNWLATASRDKTIKVWDLSSKPALEFTINTIASVGRVKWRPGRKHHIASCALVVDCSVNVWDVRRPYIPFAAFDQHKDVATGVAWRGDPHVFLSTSRDCTLYQHVFQDASRPANKANPQGFHMNSRGDVAFASRTQVSQSRAAKLTGMLRKAPQHNDFVVATSKMQWFSAGDATPMSPDVLVRECARRYVLTGRSFPDMCEHNATVARQLGRTHISLVWSILKTLHSTRAGELSQQTPSGTGSRDDVALSMIHGSIGTSAGVETVIGLGSICNDELLAGVETPGDKMSAGDEEPDAEETVETHFNGGFAFNMQGHTVPQGDFVFGDGEVDQLSVDYDQLNSGVLGLGLGPVVAGTNLNAEVALPGQEWVLEREAFQLRHELEDRSPPPEKFASRSPDLSETETQPAAVEDQPSSMLCITSMPQLPVWDASATVVAMLRHHGDTLGDAQTASCVLIVLGDRRKSLGALDEATQEHWLMGYLEVLARHQLWEVATQVIQLSWLSSVNQLNQQSTTVHTCCSRCGKPFKRSGWLCDRCHTVEAASCSVCHGTVKGLYVWCQGCAHGGHLEHVQQWWAEGNTQCATGCGHVCEYS